MDKTGQRLRRETTEHFLGGGGLLSAGREDQERTAACAGVVRLRFLALSATLAAELRSGWCEVPKPHGQADLGDACSRCVLVLAASVRRQSSRLVPQGPCWVCASLPAAVSEVDKPEFIAPRASIDSGSMRLALLAFALCSSGWLVF
ncbi:hypothetical protein [Mycobacterium colombiense]|uniref:hypothetical protein n=1 Tax=Mycobacterium colombiense TaxID=339268 RepID=UPI001152B9EE|nr:hypothetical protein [Mycobacterium colombiense]